MRYKTAARNPRARFVIGPAGWLRFLLACAIASLPRAASAQTVTEFPTVTARVPFWITAGPDGNLWFTAIHSLDKFVGRITTAGAAIFLIRRG